MDTVEELCVAIHWKPSIRDYEKEKQEIRFCVMENDSMALPKPRGSTATGTTIGTTTSVTTTTTTISTTNAGLVGDSMVSLSKESETVEHSYNRPTAIAWTTIVDEIQREKQSYMFMEEQKRRKESTGSDFSYIRSDIKFSYPVIHRKMMAHLVMTNVKGDNVTSVPEDLSCTWFEENLIQSRNMMHESWSTNMRSSTYEAIVKCLELAIICHPLRFYPSTMIEVFMILDEFAQMVTNRVDSIECNDQSVLDSPSHYYADDSKCLALNWYVKACSTPEIAPKLYLMFACIPVRMRFEIIDYNTAMAYVYHIRGISNLLVAIYLRMYLIKVASIHLPQYTQSIAKACLEDSTLALLTPTWQDPILALEKCLTYTDCCDLLTPALKYIMSYALAGVKQGTFVKLMKRFENIQTPSTICAALSCFPPSIVATNALQFIKIFEALSNNGYPTSKMISGFGQALCRHHQHTNVVGDIDLLNKCWNVVRKYENIHDYLICIPHWLGYCLQCCRIEAADSMLKDCLKRITTDPSAGYLYSYELRAIVLAITNHVRTYENLMSLDNFFPLIECMRVAEDAIYSSIAVLESNALNTCSEITDHNVKQWILKVFKFVNENYRETMLELQHENIEKAIENILHKISIENNLNECIQICSDARANLYKFECIYATLIHRVTFALTKEIKHLAKSHDNASTTDTTIQPYFSSSNALSDVIQGALSFCFITIPAIINSFHGLNLAIFYSQLSLHLGKLGQAYAFMELVIEELNRIAVASGTAEDTLLKKKFTMTPEEITQVITNTLSTLLVFPDHPEKEPLDFVKRITLFIPEFRYPIFTSLWKAKLLSHVVSLLSSFLQKRYTYCCGNAQSNCDIYAYSSKFRPLVMSLAQLALQDVERYLADHAHHEEERQGYPEVIDRIMCCSDMDDPNCRRYLSHLQSMATL